MLTKQMKAIAQLLNGGKPLFASTSFISFPTAGIIESPLISITNPDINPANKTLFKFIDFIFLVFK